MASTREEADIDIATPSGDPLIDGLLGEFYWSKLARENFQFTMPDSPDDYRATRDGLINDYPDDTYLGVNPMPIFMRVNIRIVIDSFNEILPFTITEQGDNNVDTQIRYGFTNKSIAKNGVEDSEILSLGVRWPEDDGFGTEQENWMSGDIFLREGRFTSPSAADLHGTVQLFSILHGTGHALGLKHGDVAEDGFNPLPSARDTLEFTVMTSRRFVGDSPSLDPILTAGNFPQTLMMLDIQALQYLYGADFNTRKGDTTYSWKADGTYLVNSVKEWTSSSAVIFQTIWDGGGDDTYDFSAFTGNQDIDLAPGSWSNVGSNLANLGEGHTARGNVFNALQFQGSSSSLIENAVGGGGDDTIKGYTNNNSLVGGRGDDDVFGGQGNDTITGGAGGDLINGGEGVDVAVYASPGGEKVTVRQIGRVKDGNWAISGPDQAADDVLTKIESFLFGNGPDRVTVADSFAASTVTIDGGGGDDRLIGSEGLTDRDILIGGRGADTIAPGLGSFNAFGGVLGVDGKTWIERPTDDDTLNLDRSNFNGNYRLDSLDLGDSPFKHFISFTDEGTSEGRGFAHLFYTGSGFSDDVDGGRGSDTIIGNGGVDNFNAGDGRDFVSGGEGEDGLSGDAGNDTVDGGAGTDRIFGLAGNDLLRSGNAGVGTEGVSGGLGNDTLLGGSGSQSLDGDEGRDKLSGGDGEDFLGGDLNADTLEGGAGKDFINGGDGVDLLSYASSNAGVTINLALKTASGGDAAQDVISEMENVRGSLFVDVLTGDAGRNLLFGLDGADRLTGAGGNDRLEGEEGADVFRYPAKAFGRDTIVDFQNGIDRISLVGSGLTFASFAETRDGNNTLLSLKSAPANTITLLNILPADISAGDFLI